MKEPITKLIDVIHDPLIEDIKIKYRQVIHKGVFITLLAQKLGKSQSSLRVNWFSSWSIPKEHQKDVLDYITNYLKYQ